MPQWALGIVALVLLWWLLRGLTQSINNTIRESGRQLEQKLEHLSTLTVALTGTVSNLAAELTQSVIATQKLLKPLSHVAESQIENTDVERLAQVSRKVDVVTEAAERLKGALDQQKIQEARDDEQWKKQDAEVQARLRHEKELSRILRGNIQEQSGVGNDPPNKEELKRFIQDSLASPPNEQDHRRPHLPYGLSPRDHSSSSGIEEDDYGDDDCP